MVVDLPEELHQEIRLYSVRTNRPMKEYAVEWIERGFAAEQKRVAKKAPAA